MAREPVGKVRGELVLSRCGIWSMGVGDQLALPIEAEGPSVTVIASGSLQITPDYDVLAWLCERWARQPTVSGVMRPTYYEIGADLYRGPPSGKDYRVLRESIWRLADIKLEFRGVDLLTREAVDAEGKGQLFSLSRPRREPTRGLDRFSVELDGWLRRAITDGIPVSLDWRTLRSFKRNEKLAKRLWIYLEAEKWQPAGARLEYTWVILGDKLFAALGMSHARPRRAREAIKAATATIARRDLRYAEGVAQFEFRRNPRRLYVKRPDADAWKNLRRLPAGPFQDWAVRRLEVDSESLLAGELGLRKSQLRDWIFGTRRYLPRRPVEDALERTGVALAELYPNAPGVDRVRGSGEEPRLATDEMDDGTHLDVRRLARESLDQADWNRKDNQ